MGVHSSEYHENYCKISLTLRVERCFLASLPLDLIDFYVQLQGPEGSFWTRSLMGLRNCSGSLLAKVDLRLCGTTLRSCLWMRWLLAVDYLKIVLLFQYYFRYRRTPAWPSPAMRPPSGRCWVSWSWSNSMVGSVHRWVAGASDIFIKRSFFLLKDGLDYLK